MKLLSQNPPPALLTGHSPPEQPARTPFAQTASPRFGALIGLTPNSLSQFTTDTLGVWAPKVPITRSKTQFFEDAFLELVEDGAFYFTLPIVGPLLGVGLAKLASGVKDWRQDENLTKLATHLELTDKGKVDARKLVGHPMRQISEKLEALVKEGKFTQKAADDILKQVVRTKAGALIGTVGVAAGFEYMIQHTKNVITAKGFKTKNFAAVAGLEKGKAHTQEGLTDPVEKAKKRTKQVGALVAGSLGAALATPFLLKIGGQRAAEEVMKVVDCKKGFDISKPILAMLIGTGVASYLDAARDPLEKKETGTRLCIVVPYLLFGKELAGFGITKFKENFTKVVVGQDKNGKDIKKPIKEILPLTTGNPFKKMTDRRTLLDFNVVKDRKAVIEEINSPDIKTKLAKLGGDAKDEMLKQVKGNVIAEHGKLNIYSYLFGALGCGLGMNWLIYKQTQARYKKQQEQAKQQQNANNTAQAPAQVSPPVISINAAFRGNPQQASTPMVATLPWQQEQQLQPGSQRPWPAATAAQPFANNAPAPKQFAGQFTQS